MMNFSSLDALPEAFDAVFTLSIGFTDSY